MVREIVVDADPGAASPKLQPPAYAGEACERGQRLRRRHADMARGGDRRERIHSVVRAAKRPAHFAKRLAGKPHLEPAIGSRRAGFPPPLPTEALYRRPSALGQY